MATSVAERRQGTENTTPDDGRSPAPSRPTHREGSGRRSDGPLGVLGGAFDPVHHGHLRLAIEIREQLGLARVHLLPTGNPVHRGAPRAPADARARMLAAAIGAAEELVLDRRELARSGPSFMVETLGSLRAEWPDRPLWLVLGMDQFEALDTWHRWEELLDYAHIAVGQRQGSRPPADGPVAQLLRAHRGDPGRSPRAPHGTIAIVPIPTLDISSTRVRALLASGRDPRYLLPAAVLSIIRTEGLYADAK